MNRTEQKEKLTDIIEIIDEVIEVLESREEQLNVISAKIAELGTLIYQTVQVDDWSDIELTRKVVVAIVQDTRLEEAYDLAVDFQAELEMYMDEISDARREKLEERYMDLDQSVENLEYDEDNELMLEEVIDILRETKGNFESMKKGR